MSPDVALDPSYRALYPFCRLTGPANVLVMPGLHSAYITSRLAPRLGGGGTHRAADPGPDARRATAADGRVGEPDRRHRHLAAHQTVRH